MSDNHDKAPARGKCRRLNPALTWGIILLIATAILGWLAPVVAPYAPDDLVARPHIPPSAAYPLGTDSTGRDSFSRLLYSIRMAYASALGAVLITALGGIALGVLAGYYGGKLDALLMRCVDIWLSIPGLLSILMLVALLDPVVRDGAHCVVIAVGLGGIPAYTRLVRGLTIQEKSQLYVESAIALGAGPLRIMLRHIVPNLLSGISSLLAIRFGYAILAVGSLSFLGIGIQPTVPELGNMLRDGEESFNFYPWAILGPVAIFWITMLGANLIRDGLAEKAV